MTRTDLVRTASQIPPFPPETAKEFEMKREAIVSEMNALMLARDDVDALVGANNREMMQDNHANKSRFIHAMLVRFDPEELVDTVLWVFRAYRAHGFKDAYWSAALNTWLAVLGRKLSPEVYSNILPLFDWMIINIPHFVGITNDDMEEKSIDTVAK